MVKIREFLSRQWVQMRGNAKWELAMTGINLFLAFLGKITLGPFWQMWTFLTIAGFCFAMWVLFPGMWKKTWYKIAGFGVILIVMLGCIWSYKQSAAIAAAPVVMDQNSGNNSTFQHVSQSSNVNLNNNSGNQTTTVNGGVVQSGSGNNQIIGNNNFIYINGIPTNNVALPDIFNGNEPYLTRIFNLLRDKGATFSLGSGEQLMKFTLGDLMAQDTNVYFGFTFMKPKAPSNYEVQNIFISGDGFGFEGSLYNRPITNGPDAGVYIKTETGFESSDFQAISLRPPDGAFIPFSLMRGNSFVIDTKLDHIRISLIDIAVDSLKIKIDVSHAESDPWAQTNGYAYIMGDIIISPAPIPPRNPPADQTSH
jgi:hypothetical protein